MVCSGFVRKGLVGSVFAVLGLAFVASSAQAISRYNPTTMTCSKVKATVKGNGEVILRWPSTRDPSRPLYGRYVANQSYCGIGEIIISAYVPAADTKSCRVLQCRRRTFFEDDDDDLLKFWWRR